MAYSGTLVVSGLFMLPTNGGQAFTILAAIFLGLNYLPVTPPQILWISIGAVVVLQALFTYFPPMQDIFGVEAVPLSIWKWLLLGGVILFLLVELEKLVIRNMRSQSGEAPAA